MASRESCRGNQNCEKKGGGSDCGYSSGADGCDNCSVPSSNDSDVVYLDNVCSSQDGEYLLPLTPDPFCPLKTVAKRNIVQSSVFFLTKSSLFFFCIIFLFSSLKILPYHTLIRYFKNSL